MICDNCGTENPRGRRFCGECGAPLAVTCPSCGAGNEPRFRFCGECGAPLTESGPTPDQSGGAESPLTERRLVSVLFADLVGFTALAESRDADDVRDLLSRYFDTCRGLIARYGGIVEKFIGDAVMAVWGTPTAQEDDAERAVRAALDLAKAVEALGAELSTLDLRARVGVLTGEAAVNLRAEGEGMVAGDLVNTASRIQASAPPGAVYVGEATRRATEAAVVYAEAGTHELKGKAEPVPLWQALRVVGGRGGALRARGLEAPFVGRDRELRLLKDLFHGSAEERRARLVSVLGVAGIGKSRLSWEFFKYIDGLSDTAYWHRGRCLSYGDGVTYWALADMVRGRAGILDTDDAGAASAKLRAALEGTLSGDEERAWVEPRLAHLLGLEDRTAREPEDLFSAWRVFFERLAERYPTILVFEDMQWADPSLLDFIDYMLTWSRSHRLFVLSLARPELTERHPDWAAGRRASTALHLDPLPAGEMDRLLSGLVPGLPSELREQILERAEGVPLYAVETVRMLLDRGFLEQEGASYRLTGAVESLAVPETLHALIAARLDGLESAERALVQTAAVLGKTFTKDALAALSGDGEAGLPALLTSLVRKEVLTVQADPRSPDRGQYGFLQDLVRKVAYETLSRREAKARHLAAAEHLERAHGPDELDVAEVIASHYLQAYRVGPDAADAAQIKTRAAGALVRSAERSASLAANREALRYFEQALELTDDPLERAGLHERAGRVAFSAGRIEQSRAHVDEAIALFQREGKPHAAARVVGMGANIAFSDGRLDEALARMDEAFAALSDDEPDQDLAWLAANMARMLYFTGQRDLALERSELALFLAESFELPEVLSQALNTKGIILDSMGRKEEGILLLRHALQIALDHDLHEAALRACNNVSATLLGHDRLQEALALSDQGLELSRRFGSETWEWKFLAGSVSLLVPAGQWDSALSRAEEIHQLEGAMQFQGVALELTQLIDVHVQRGDLAEARRMLEELGGMGGSGDLQVRAHLAVAWATLLQAEGRHREALEQSEIPIGATAQLGAGYPAVRDGPILGIEAALALGDLDRAEELIALLDGLRPGQLTPFLSAHRDRLRARITAARGEDDRVGEGFSAAEETFRAVGMPFPQAVTLLEHAEWLSEQARASEAAALLEEARILFEALGARPWLDRVAVATGATSDAARTAEAGAAP